MRLWTRNAIDRLDEGLRDLQAALIEQAEENAATLMPGFTHLQPAQPVTFGHHLLAYAEMFGRDRGRFADARRRMNESPLGAAALAGTSFPIDRHMTAKALGFDRPMANSLDAVSDRDFALEFLSAASIAGIHLSRLAEEIVIWSSDAFRFVKLSEAFTTGSSIMPQKRNPDAAELIRAKAGALIGAQMQLQILMKGLPLAYNKDFQDSKPPVMRTADELDMMLSAMTGMIRDMSANKEAMLLATSRGFLTATDLADWLVQELGMPFRQAHHVTGKIVRMAEERNCRLDELELPEMQKIEKRITAAIYQALKPETAIARRTSHGGTAPKLVKAEVKRWQGRLNAEKSGQRR
jgi:argininosuccinate lyase